MGKRKDTPATPATSATQDPLWVSELSPDGTLHIRIPRKVLPFPLRYRRARQLELRGERLRAAALTIKARQHELSEEVQAAVTTLLELLTEEGP